MASKTVHVYPTGRGWSVKREGAKGSRDFPTQKQAIDSARTVAKESAPSQLVVHSKDGRIRDYTAYGLPKVQDPPGGKRSGQKIEKAVSKVALERVLADLEQSQ